MLDSILRHAGCNVGMFTSPHLVDFTERFQINREKISREDVYRLVKKVRETGVPLTFFELTAAVAFLYFHEKKTDYVMLEVGMGGRLDATNIAKPFVTVITSISFDHMTWLGGTLEKISAEKAGIVKEGIPLFTAVDNRIIRSVCAERNAPLSIVNREEETGMNGSFQRINAGIAASVARYMKIRENNIKTSLMDVYWPALLEFVEKNVLLDCAHNPDGVEKIAEFVKSLEYDKLIIVFGVMKDKNHNEMLGKLPGYDTLILAKPKIDRSLDPKELNSGIIIEDVGKAYEYAKSISSKNDLILICGSCYLAGEFLAWKNKIPMHPVMFVQ